MLTSFLQAQEIVNQCTPQDQPRPVVNKPWVYRFRVDHPELFLRTAVYLDIRRLQASTYSNLQPFYERLYSLDPFNPFCPELIYNLDETSINPNKHRKRYVFGLKGTPVSSRTILPRMPNATLLFIICADGTYLDPHLIWYRKTPDPEVTRLKAYHINVWYSHGGWMKRKLFRRMMLKVILPSLVQRRELLNKTAHPIVIILDAHSSRKSKKVIKYCIDHNIILICIPAHSSHLTQPLDRSSNGVFKVSVSMEIEEALKTKEQKQLTPKEFRDILVNTLPACVRKAMRDSVIIGGFKAAGMTGIESRDSFLATLARSISSPTLASGTNHRKKETIQLSGKILTSEINLDLLTDSSNGQDEETESSVVLEYSKDVWMAEMKRIQKESGKKENLPSISTILTNLRGAVQSSSISEPEELDTSHESETFPTLEKKPKITIYIEHPPASDDVSSASDISSSSSSSDSSDETTPSSPSQKPKQNTNTETKPRLTSLKVIHDDDSDS